MFKIFKKHKTLWIIRFLGTIKQQLFPSSITNLNPGPQQGPLLQDPPTSTERPPLFPIDQLVSAKHLHKSKSRTLLPEHLEPLVSQLITKTWLLSISQICRLVYPNAEEYPWLRLLWAGRRWMMIQYHQRQDLRLRGFMGKMHGQMRNLSLRFDLIITVLVDVLLYKDDFNQRMTT